ncbi:MAG TPA: hypothetical protein VGM85_20655 [Paraburkholderia sp.]
MYEILVSTAVRYGEDYTGHPPGEHPGRTAYCGASNARPNCLKLVIAVTNALATARIDASA